MSSGTNGKLHLEGPGGAYLRVSGDRQETERQLASRAAFEKRHERRRLPQHHRYEDDMPRDLSAKRQDFQRMLKAAAAGTLQWIFVDHIDRFGFADEWELVELIQVLRKAGCKLYDSNDDEWTARGLMSFFKAGLAGHSSHDEQVKKSLSQPRRDGRQGQGGRVARRTAPARVRRCLLRPAARGRSCGGSCSRAGQASDGEAERQDAAGLLHPPGEGVPQRPHRAATTATWSSVPARTRRSCGSSRRRDEGQTRCGSGGVRAGTRREAVSFFDLAKWLNEPRHPQQLRPYRSSRTTSARCWPMKPTSGIRLSPSDATAGSIGTTATAASSSLNRTYGGRTRRTTRPTGSAVVAGCSSRWWTDRPGTRCRGSSVGGRDKQGRAHPEEPRPVPCRACDLCGLRGGDGCPQRPHGVLLRDMGQAQDQGHPC